MAEIEYKKLDVERIFKESFAFCKENSKFFLRYTFINMFLVLFFQFALGGIANPFCLLWLIGYYVFWSIFFRDIFKQTPCYKKDCIFHSLVPSTKVLLITILVVTLLMFLPMLPMLLVFVPNLPVETRDFVDGYLDFFKKYTEDSDVMDLLTSFIFILVAPFVFFRPFYAGISSVLGKSGSLTLAYRKTEHNYWRFFVVGTIMTVSCLLLKQCAEYIGDFSTDAEVSEAISSLILYVVSSPVVVYFNVILAKSYEFFFVEK